MRGQGGAQVALAVGQHGGNTLSAQSCPGYLAGVCSASGSAFSKGVLAAGLQRRRTLRGWWPQWRRAGSPGPFSAQRRHSAHAELPGLPGRRVWRHWQRSARPAAGARRGLHCRTLPTLGRGRQGAGSPGPGSARRDAAARAALPGLPGLRAWRRWRRLPWPAGRGCAREGGGAVRRWAVEGGAQVALGLGLHSGSALRTQSCPGYLGGACGAAGGAAPVGVRALGRQGPSTSL